MNGGSSTSQNFCGICQKPLYYFGDTPQGGFKVGCEPYCTCGTEICSKCGQRYTPNIDIRDRYEKVKTYLTTDELIEKLPKAMHEDDLHLMIDWEHEEICCVSYNNIHTNFIEIDTQGHTLHEALEKMYNKLKELGDL